MAIQFTCPSCTQPIEVDDDHAGQTARCPYCYGVVTVPAQSTYQPAQSAMARPINPPPPAGSAPPAAYPPPVPPPPYPPYAVPPPAAKPSTYGNYALVCTLLALALFGIMVVRVMVLMAQGLAKISTSQPTPQDIERVQQQMLRNPDSFILAGQFGSAFFALVGVVLGIVAVRQNANSWQAWLSLVFCGLLLLCFCGGVIFSAAAGLGRGAVIFPWCGY